MSRRSNAVARTLLVLALVFSSLAVLLPVGTSAAQSTQGLQGDDSYQSPQFGYSVTWSEPWEVRERDVISNPGGFDTITLRSTDGSLQLSGRSDDYSALTFLQDSIAIQIASGAQVINQDTTGEVPTAELLVGREKIRLDVVTLPDASAIVLVTLRADERDYDIAFANASERIQIDDEPLYGWTGATPVTPTEATATDVAPTATEEPDPTEAPATATPLAPTEAPATEETPGPLLPTQTPEATATEAPESTVDVIPETETPPATATEEPQVSGIEGNSYTSPNFGFSISWDPDVWSAREDSEASQPGFDLVALDSATGPAVVTGWEGYNGDVATCLAEETLFYSEQNQEAGVSALEPALDAEGNELTGETENSAWAVFISSTEDETVETREYVEYIECVSLGDGESVVIFYSYSFREDYNDHIEGVLALVESLELPASPDAPAGTEAVPTELPTELPETPEATAIATAPPSTPTTDDQQVTVGRTVVRWTGDWQFDPASSMEEQATLEQFNPTTGSITIATYGEFQDETFDTAVDAIDVFAATFFESAGASSVAEVDSGELEGGTSWKMYTFDLQRLDLTFLITAREVNPGAYVISTLTGGTATFPEDIEQAQSEILLNGEPAFLQGIDAAALDAPATPVPTQQPEPAASPEAPTASTPADLTGGEVITGESYSYSFSIPAGWQLEDTRLAGEVERTALTNGTSTVTIEARPMTVPALSECVTTAADEHETDPAYGDLALARTANGDAFSGEDDFKAFANFTFTGPDDETWAHFIECRWIAEGETALLVIHDAPQELFSSERASRRQIQNSIEIGE